MRIIILTSPINNAALNKSYYCRAVGLKIDLNHFSALKISIFRGINVLNNKTELEKAFAKHKKNLDEKRKEQESTDAFTDEFKKMIAERAKRLEKVQSSDFFFVQSMIY